MALISCHDCGAKISSEAEQCPKCGAKPKRSMLGAIVLGALICAVIAFWAANH